MPNPSSPSSTQPSLSKKPTESGAGSVPDARSIGPAGTIARIVLGAGLLALILVPGQPHWWQIALGLAGFPAAMVLVQAGHARLAGIRLHATGPLGYSLNLLGAPLLIYGPTQPAFGLFIAASMLVGAWRGYAGCEITAISNWLLRRDDQIGCVILSPIDQAERRSPH